MKTKDEHIATLKSRVNRLVREKGIDGSTILSWQKQCVILKKALLIMGGLANGCPKIEKADHCNEWTTGRACPKCRADNAIEQAQASGKSLTKEAAATSTLKNCSCGLPIFTNNNLCDACREWESSISVVKNVQISLKRG